LNSLRLIGLKTHRHVLVFILTRTIIACTLILSFN
jgi:hypothetical protein